MCFATQATKIYQSWSVFFFYTYQYSSVRQVYFLLPNLNQIAFEKKKRREMVLQIYLKFIFRGVTGKSFGREGGGGVRPKKNKGVFRAL